MKQVYLIEPDDFETIYEMVETIKAADHKVRVEISKPSKSRSTPQNSYYWFVLKEIGNFLGYTNDQMHEIFRFKFLQVSDDKFTKVSSTTDLSTIQFERYLDKIRQFCSVELSFIVPLPNEVELNTYDEYFML